MPTWRNYTALYPGADHTITGTIKVAQAIHSPQLDNTRDILVYLPPGYDASADPDDPDGGRRYPVIYMHDGQNLFDAATSFAGVEWGVDETLDALHNEGIAAIVVGIPNVDGEIAGARLDEYSPHLDQQIGRGGRGNSYLAFICDTLKPMIDARFRTLPDRAHTGLIGSSMGGLISLYGFFSRPMTFGFAGVLSPALWFANGSVFEPIRAARFTPDRIYLDVGTQEESPTHHAGASDYLELAHAMRDLLLQKGYRAGRELLYVEEEGAIHHESAWAQRLPDALRFLLG